MITAKQAIERAARLVEDHGASLAPIANAIRSIDLERKPRSDRKQERDAEIVAMSDNLTPAQLAEKFSISKQRVSIILKAARDKA